MEQFFTDFHCGREFRTRKSRVHVTSTRFGAPWHHLEGFSELTLGLSGALNLDVHFASGTTELPYTRTLSDVGLCRSQRHCEEK